MSEESGGQKPFAFGLATKAEKIYAAEAEEKVAYWYPDGICHKAHRTREDGTVTWFFRWSPTAVQTEHGFSDGARERESPAHEIAKELIAKRGMVGVITPSGPIMLWLNDVVSEELLDRRKPDLSATVAQCYPAVLVAGTRVHVEIFVTHGVDQEKRIDLERRNEPVLEVDLASSLSKKSRRMMFEDPEGFREHLWQRLVAVPPGSWIVPPPRS